MTFIDLHTHGLAGIDARSKEPEDYLRLAEAYKSHGTDAFLPTLFPAPIDEMRAVLKAIRRAMEMQNVRPYAPGGPPGSRPLHKGNEQKPGQAVILGAHVEGPFVNPLRCGALGQGALLPATVENLDRLVDSFEDVIRIMTVAPELPGAPGLIERAVQKGILVNMGHSDATFIEAKEGERAGATGVTHLFNAMSGLNHREPGLAAYALSSERLYVELIADMAHVHPEMLRLVLRLKRRERVVLVSDSLGPAKSAGAAPGKPMLMPDGKTLAGSGITLAEAVKNIISLGVPEAVASAFAGPNPAAYLGLAARRNPLTNAPF